MNGWLIVGGLGAVAVVVIVLVIRGRPRTADQVLRQAPRHGVSGAPSATPRPLPPPVAATDQPVREVLDSLVARRATGRLTVQSGDQICAISLLFGRVFDAECGTLLGNDALRQALTWPSPRSSFETRTRLPTRETITRPTGSWLEAPPTDPRRPPA